jgi:pyoverdine/dityrosine biosynthesis protein Dit1
LNTYSKLTINKEDIKLEDEEEKMYFEKLIQFEESDAKVLDFPSSLNKKQRAKIHKIADFLGISRVSFSCS